MAAANVVGVVDVCAGALLLDADDWRRDGRVGVEMRALPLDDHLLRPLRDRLGALRGKMETHYVLSSIMPMCTESAVPLDTLVGLT